MQINSMFKTIILLSVAVTHILCLDKKVFEDCTKELQVEVSPTTGAILRFSNTTCLSKCIYQKQGRLDENGKTIPENNHKVLQPYLKACEEKVKEENPCKRVQEIDDCFDDSFEAISKDISKFCAQETKTEYKETDEMNFEEFEKACFNKCNLNVMGVLDDKGDINFSYLYTNEEYRYVNNIDKVIEKCDEEHKEDDPCLRSMKRFNCFMATFEN